MSPTPPGHCAIHRSLAKAQNLLYAVGDFKGLFAAYAQHVKRWDEVLDPLAVTMMRQGLAAAALYLSCRPRDEIVAWTLSVQTPPINLFLTGDAGNGSVTGRAYLEGVKAAERNRLFVQTTGPNTEASRSLIEVEGLDLLDIFESYHRQSEQRATRYFEHGEGVFSLVAALPDADVEHLKSIGREQALAEARAAPPLDVRNFQFSCGCTQQRIQDTIQALPDSERDWLFADADVIEAHCPRCGHRWLVAKRGQYLA